MRKRRFRLVKRLWPCCYGCCSSQFGLSEQEVDAYMLIDFLVNEIDRLTELVMDARYNANALACEFYVQLPYPDPCDNVYNGSCDDHPAMYRYRALFHKNEIC